MLDETRKSTDWQVWSSGSDQARVFPDDLILFATITRIGCSKIEYRIPIPGELHSHLMLGDERRNRFLPSFRAVFLTDMSYVRKSPKSLLPRSNLLNRKLLITKFLSQWIEQHGWILAREGPLKGLKIPGAQSFDASSSLYCLEILRKR